MIRIPRGEISTRKRLTFKIGKNKISQTIGDTKDSAYNAFWSHIMKRTLKTLVLNLDAFAVLKTRNQRTKTSMSFRLNSP